MERFIAVDGDYCGYWGVGDAPKAANHNLRKAGGGKPTQSYRFTSSLPFAPSNREAHKDEADCWIGEDGSVNWIRCERELLTTTAPKPLT